jgi:hypothetical protein
MITVSITCGVDDRLKPLGAIVSDLTRECWLCDMFVAGVRFERVNDTDITMSEREYTKLCLFYTTPDLVLHVISRDIV